MADGSIARTSSRPGSSRWWRATPHLLVVALVLALHLVQQPGRITFDTKLDLQLDPGGLLGRSTTLWNPEWALGGLQNQASGYLFPMGPVFWLGELAGVPMWVWERLWSALVMLVAYEGARRLGACWPGIGSAGAILAGLTYMLSPRILTTVGGLSGEALPAAVLPWAVVPLVLYLRGRLRWWHAFVMSSAVVPFMGGQNATLVVACMVMPAMLLAFASGRTWRRRVSDTAVWGCLVAISSLWWLVPLLLLGAYAPPFLDFIESADNTAGATGWLASLRGTSHWVAFFPGGGEVGWRGGYELASSSVLLVSTVAVAAVGLLGLLQCGLWQRRTLVATLVVGLAVLTAGSGGWAGSLFSDAWLHLLDTSLAPLRNIHKFDPVVRLPLSLGVGAWVTLGLPRHWRRSPDAEALPVRALATAAVAALIVAAAGPAAAGSMRSDSGFEEIPGSWRGALDYLRDQPTPTRTLVLPGAGFAVQTWGRTIDEPIQVLDPPPWLARAQVTVAPAGTLRLLDSVEQSFAEGRPQERVAESLALLGVTHVVVRGDLDEEATDAPTAEMVRATMSHVSGAREVATFGGEPDGVPELVVYELDPDADPRVSVQDWDDRVLVHGGPEVVPDLLAAGLVREDQAVVLTDEGHEPDVVTDSLRRVERAFGRVHDARSGVMTARDRYRVSRAAHDYSDAAMPAGRTTATYDGAAAIVASSSSGYADVLGPVHPERHPYAAFDKSIFTAWETAPFSRPRGQWVELRFDEPTDISDVSLTFDTVTGVTVTSVRITTDDKSVAADVAPDGTVEELGVDDASTTRLRVTVAGVTSETGQVRLSDVRLAGHDVTRSLSLPGGIFARTDVFVSSEAPQRACTVEEDDTVTCDATRQRETPETPGFDRTLRVEEGGTWHVEGRAMATHDPGLAELFAPLDPTKVSISASSTFGGDPAVNAAGAMDGRPDTVWLSAPGDPAPALQLSWGPRRVVSRLVMSEDPEHPGSLPEAVVVDAGPGTGDPQLVATTGPRAGEMRAVRTDQLRVTAFGHDEENVIGISELDVTGIEDLRHDPDPETPTGTLCGFGPQVEIGGQVMPTRLSGTLGDVRSGAGLSVVACDSRGVRLPAGEHHLRVTNPPGFAATDLSLRPTALPVSPQPLDPPRVLSWSASERRVELSAASDSVLGVSESFNKGWTATVGGRSLRPVVLEGWKQGFQLPAGTAGVVTLHYAPQAVFRVSLVGGLVLAALLILLAAGLLVRRAMRRGGSVEDGAGPREATPLPRPPGIVSQLLVLVALAVVSLPLALGALLGRLTRRRGAVVAVISVGALTCALLVALLASSVVVPPAASDVLAAIAVGAVCARALVSTDAPDHGQHPSARVERA